MNQAGSNGPHIREAFYVVLATFTLYLVTLLIVSGNDPVSLLLAETSIVLPVIVWVRMRRYPFRAVFRLQQINPLLILLGLIIGFGFSILTGELNFLIQKIVPMQREVLEGLTEAMVYESPFDLIVMILTFVVIAGIGEELLFRGLLLGALEKSVNVTRAVIYSSLVFTFMHFNPWWTLEIFFLGILTGVLAWRSNSLYPAIAMHAMVNLMSILLTNEDLPFLRLYPESGHTAPIWLLASGAGVAGGMVLFHVCARRVLS